MGNEQRSQRETDLGASTQIRRRILIVDDDPASRETLCAQLTLENIDILAVDSGREALRRMSQFVPDVIVLDVMMPEMDGYTVCRQLKNSADYRHIPVILVTALDSVGDRVRGLEAGADEYITKPVTRMELQARVQTMLRIKTQYDDLERMLEMRQALSYMIVHDLRNPLAAVTLYLQLLKRKGSMPVESIKYLDLAAAESQKMSNFLDDMLMLAKMERGKLTLSYSPLYLERLIASAHAKFDLLAEAQGVQFSVEMPSQPYPLMADVALFQRVVENLVANALKFAPAQTTITAIIEYPRPKTTRLPNYVSVYETRGAVSQQVIAFACSINMKPSI